MKEYDVKDLYLLLLMKGKEVSPRGQKVLEVQFFQGEILNPWSNYAHRHYPISYFKREFQWYLNANSKDLRICDHAKLWSKLIQEDGSIFSNYGALWFNGAYDRVLRTLQRDPDSRQAIINMLSDHHMFEGNKDVVCTKNIIFQVRNDLLDVHVCMRSSDVVYGLATDLPCFWYLWNMMAIDLGISMGKFIFSSDSLHMYEKHYNLVKKVVDEPLTIGVNAPDLTDTADLLSQNFKTDFGKWIAAAKL